MPIKQSILLWLLFLLMFCQSGCKKDPELPADYLRMNIDGVKIECNAHIQATDQWPFPTQLLDISGNWSTTALESGAIEIELYSFDNTPGQRQLENPSLHPRRDPRRSIQTAPEQI